jgi:23S rRNA (adenine1618-N6)-methyltransferase
LNRAILLHDYNLAYYSLPLDEGLVPTVPSRREYIHWIYDLFKKFEGRTDKLHGLDIGVGASAIYPVIGVKEYGWSFVGSDVCEESLKIAQEIIDKNDLSDTIVLKFQPRVKQIFEGIIDKSDKSQRFDFSM